MQQDQYDLDLARTDLVAVVVVCAGEFSGLEVIWDYSPQSKNALTINLKTGLNDFCFWLLSLKTITLCLFQGIFAATKFLTSQLNVSNEKLYFYYIFLQYILQLLLLSSDF